MNTLKRIILELSLINLLLILTVISSCLTPNSYSLALISLGLLAYNIGMKYLDIRKIDTDLLLKVEDIQSGLKSKEIELHLKLTDLETKVNHLGSKDAVKDLYNGLSTQKR